MKVDIKKLLLIILLLSTIVLAGGAIFIGYRLSRSPQVEPSDASALVCNQWSGVQCWYDNPTNVCNPPEGGDDVFRHMQGRRICTGSQAGQFGECTFYDACAPFVREGDPCNGTYRGKNVAGGDVRDDRIRRLSTGEGQNFIGCEGVVDAQNNVLGSSGRNCFCDTSPVTDPSLPYSANFPVFNTGVVRCNDDMNMDSCGANVVIITPTSTPTVTPTATNSPTPTITTTATITPTASPTVTMTPTISPTGTVITPTPTNSSTPTPTLTVTTTPSLTVTPTRIVIITPSLPQTAIFNDNSDKIIVGVIFLLFGICMIFLGTDRYFARILKNFSSSINKEYFDSSHKKKKQNDEFVKNIKKEDQ